MRARHISRNAALTCGIDNGGMQTVGGLLALVYAIFMVATGFSGGPLWLPLLGAVAAVGIYLMVRPRAVQMIQELWDANKAPSIGMFAAELYIAQLIPAAIMYGLGVGAGRLV